MVVKTSVVCVERQLVVPLASTVELPQKVLKKVLISAGMVVTTSEVEVETVDVGTTSNSVCVGVGVHAINEGRPSARRKGRDDGGKGGKAVSGHSSPMDA